MTNKNYDNYNSWFNFSFLSVVTEKLSGQVLKNRSGNLRTSVHFGDITETPNGITGTVGTIREYAAAHEYGGPYQVKEHLRMQTMAWGRPMTPKQVTVKEFTMNMPQRSFLRSALRETKNLIAAEYERAAKRAIAGMLK